MGASHGRTPLSVTVNPAHARGDFSYCDPTIREGGVGQEVPPSVSRNPNHPNVQVSWMLLNCVLMCES